MPRFKPITERRFSKKKNIKGQLKKLCDHFNVNPIMGELFLSEIKLFDENDLKIEIHQKMKRAAEFLKLL